MEFSDQQIAQISRFADAMSAHRDGDLYDHSKGLYDHETAAERADRLWAIAVNAIEAYNEAVADMEDED